MFDWKRRIALVAVPAALMVGGVSVTAHAATPTTTPPQATSPAAEAADTTEAADATEQPESAAAEANEPSLPGGGHSDAAGEADHQFDGVE